MNLKIKRLHENAIVPSYAHEGDAGLDLYSIDYCVIYSGERVIVKTGISIELPPGYEAQIRPRSGLALDHGITVLNAPGTIDAGYRGEIKVILINHSKAVFRIVPTMKIAQMVIAPVTRATIVEMELLTASDRGSGGFGSTGI